MSTHFHHESHGNHPLSFVGFLLTLGGFLSAALWLVHMAAGNTGLAVLFALVMLAAFTCAISIFYTIGHRYHHSPVLPDNTDAETERYIRKYRGAGRTAH
ncbi:hypothetical protein RVF83_23655 [Gordonia rubripertincta]|uniref:Uncharacterized protein n=2 Tax=Gordonia rubripertincta TaxID=36822 RepID=A0AAW4G7Z9_GORRU|nr:hypothetical protein [Gordonia rubripertincta]ASR04389.1 hypothetical protein GCWB2_18080 [Gordonia rubripertincta]MBM7279712.1 hypothetical protein [Gordonia rubripertincta]MDG6783311.1 hypothetical protein [Gordonia rubripertincta]NKY65538.1 hypothetical protein [Gordonia rubripertincta]QMU20772.1 hypothetical protein H3V45_22650 [Gordonia rubripertincta]